MSNWHVGMKVVCVKTHSQGSPKAGKTYTVRAIATCRCGEVGLDVGLLGNPYKIGTACRCSPTRHLAHIGFYPSATLFRPLDLLSAALDRIEEESVTIEEPQHA